MFGNDALIGLGEIAERLNYSLSTIYRLVWEPGFPVRRCGNLYVIDRERYLAWERSRGQPGSTGRGYSTRHARTGKKIVK